MTKCFSFPWLGLVGLGGEPENGALVWARFSGPERYVSWLRIGRTEKQIMNGMNDLVTV